MSSLVLGQGLININSRVLVDAFTHHTSQGWKQGSFFSRRGACVACKIRHAFSTDEFDNETIFNSFSWYQAIGGRSECLACGLLHAMPELAECLC